ncbi:hypothetical protein N658DRAFT_490907 [Parathielavia hyrcaniae]|uniref:Uncharacterized protein n=1 Tax=Parathielavia hyrcaniae TaxID=113614 RepID=A0AAN6Q9X6_9PEZI|nr:hypothetical protein N658DRAFT_490907 [Parathielavia hyrcaniae]
MSDTSSLADSAYEVIQATDNESQYGGLTESTCSLSAPRPDDVHSLDGSQDHYNTDSEEECDHSSHASSIRYADQTLQNPSTQPPATSSLEYGSYTGSSGVVVRSIECQETAGALLSDQISAKHVIREFSEDESSAISRNIGLPNRPKCLVASIRQTLSPSYLSTNEPFRVLYVGQAATQRAIVLKICDAIWVSPKDGSHDQDYFNRYREGLYNIVPISSFGPTPELDLMEASRYQIRVEHCTSAAVLFEDDQPNVVYSITLDKERSHRSCISPNHDPVVQPKWDLPHIAVFYLSEEDDADAGQTRDVTYDFMVRHGVPCLFIADRQDLDHPLWQNYVEQHAVHLCVDSRDPERPMHPRLFPIDLASFEDIDARQMNRNLAFLTGMSEAEDEALKQCTLNTKPLSLLSSALTSMRRACPFDTERQIPALSISSVFRRFAVMIIPLLLLALIKWLQPENSHHIHSPSSTGVCVSMPTYPVGLTTTKSSTVATSTKTVVINVTATKTVEVSQAKPSTSSLASAFSFAGLLPDKPSAVPADTEPKKSENSKKTVCSVRVHSPTEILVAVPSRNKVVWLAQGAIDIAVHRDEETIKTRVSSVDEGVLVGLDRKDAYGVLNVSVVTSRRPKINETFQVDFGTSAVAEVLHAGLHMLRDALGKVHWTDDARQAFEKSRSLPHDVVSALERASEAVRERATDTMKRTSDKVREHLASQLKSADAMCKEADLSVLQAQVASKLWWLKVQGKTKEYDEYQRNASRFLKMKHEELVDARNGKENNPSMMARLLCFRSGAYVPWRKDACREALKDSRLRDGGWDTRWRKFVRGV